ncbi:hypothetical protein [Methylobacterium sp. UNC378MF]|nr:hypothetical protein [Methylobacterium sp. UNC378MF]
MLTISAVCLLMLAAAERENVPAPEQTWLPWVDRTFVVRPTETGAAQPSP